MNIALVLITIGIALTGTPSASAAVTAPSTERPLRIAMIQEWSHFNPVTYNLASVEALLPFVVRGLVARGPGGEVIPDLAEKIPSLKNKDAKVEVISGKKKVVATWKISSKAKWGDGVPVTCADFKLGWQVGSNPNVSTQARSNFTKIEKIEWQENAPKVCTVTYINGDWTFDRDLPFPLPSHLEAVVYEKFSSQPEGYDRNSNYVKDPTHPGLYNGPYLVSEFRLGSHVMFKSNPQFLGAQPTIGKIIVTHISETSALRANLLSQQVDVVSAVGFPADAALALSEEFDRDKLPMTVRFQNSAIFQGLFLQMENEPLKDVQVRRAISLALDKLAFVKAFFKDKILPADTFLPPQHLAYQKRAPEFSREKSRQLLEQAGWKLSEKGIREKNGKSLVLEFKTSAGIKIYENLQLVLCDQLKQVGVGCKIKNEPPRVLLGETVPKGQFDIAMFGQAVLPDSSMTSSFSSKEVPSAKNSWAGANVGHWSNPQLDQLLEQFDQEWDAKKRNAIAKKIENIYLQERPFIPLYHRREAMVIPRALMGVEDEFGGTGFAFPEKWHW